MIILAILYIALTAAVEECPSLCNHEVEFKFFGSDPRTVTENVKKKV